MDNGRIDRREFVRFVAGFAAGAHVARTSGNCAEISPASGAKKWHKAVTIDMLPKGLQDSERFALARRCGFDGIEASPMTDLAAARQQADAAKAAGIAIHSVIFGGWNDPLSGGNPQIREKGLERTRTALRCTQAMGAGVLLLVPGIVTETVRYGEAYRRSQESIRKLIPLAQELQVIMAVENVWNKFLLSPLEFARYVDELESPWVRAYFDVGNVILYGFSQDWIRTLGKRIVRIHLKDFKRQGYQWTNLLEGDVNWPEVRRALDEIGYEGFMTAELGGGDEPYLRDVAKRIEKIFSS